MENDPEGGYLFLALRCGSGSAGFAGRKIWMIEHQRSVVERIGGTPKGSSSAIVRLGPAATGEERRASARNSFESLPGGPPKPLTDLLGHRLSWYRWAGPELLDA